MLSLCNFAYSQEPGTLSLQINPNFAVPFGSSSDLYTFGGGATVGVRYVLPKYPIVYIQGALDFQAMSTPANQALALITGGGEAGITYQVTPKIALEGGVLAGVYLGIFGSEMGVNPIISTGLGANISLSPSLSLGLSTSYRYYFTRDAEGMRPLWNGIGIGIGTGLRLTRGGSIPKIRYHDFEISPVFPVFHKYYNHHAFGTFTITNEENQSIENVKVSFIVGQFMEAPRECATYPTLTRGESVTIQIFALFRDDILRITEATEVIGELIVEYAIGGEMRRATEAKAIRVLDRNAMTWEDDRRAASFVTPRDPTVMRFSKIVTGDLRDHGIQSLDKNVRSAIGLYTALGLFGMTYIEDPRTPYAELSQNQQAVDYLQFPRQTLEVRTGDCDDLSLLFTALLESIGIPTAFITVPGHIYMAFRTEGDVQDAIRLFGIRENLIIVDDEAWVPVEMTLVKSGFLNAWNAGARQWKENQPDSAKLIPLAEAWQIYEPVGLFFPERDIIVPGGTNLLSSYQNALDEFVNRAIGPQIADLRRRIGASKQSAPLINRLGILYASVGQYDRAIAELEKLTGRNPYFPALINLGNVAFLKGDMNRALSNYTAASRMKPHEPTVLLGQARVQFELKMYEEARRNWQRLDEQDSSLASRFAYIVSSSVGTERASSQELKGVAIWYEQD